MRINSLIAKTALAAAIAGVSFTASAGVLNAPTPSVVANEVFGVGSETTSIRMPKIEFTANGDLRGIVAFDATSTDGATIKLTLGGNAVFAENYQDPLAWAAQGIVFELQDSGAAPTPGTLPAAGTMVPQNAASIASVTGGTAGDNQITIKLKHAAAAPLTNTAALDRITLEGFKVQNLKSALERQGAGAMRTSLVTLEVRESVRPGSTLFENTNAAIAFASVNGVNITAVPTTYTAAPGGRAMIQVVSDQKKFTAGAGVLAASDYDETTAQNKLNLGRISLARGATTTAGTLGAGGIAATIPAGKETGVAFDFTGSDTVTVSIDSSEDFTQYKDVYLTKAANCVAPKAPTDRVVTPSSKTVVIPTAELNLAVGDTYSLCAEIPVAGAASVIPETDFSVEAKVKYFNVRYTESLGQFDFGRVLRNGCQVTLFNVPNVNAADKGFVRLTNTSNRPGEVNAYIWNEAGEQKDVSAKLLDNLDAHATTIFSTDASNANAVYLGDVLPEFAEETSGRGRLVIQGAFPSCEALGLIRSSQGTLTNMTSTTNSSATTAGTSNTSN